MPPPPVTLAPELRAGASLGSRARFHAIRWLPLVGVAVVTAIAFPPPVRVGGLIPRAGQVMKRAVVAPFGFEVRKSSDEIVREAEARALTVPPAYRFSASAYDSALTAARSFFAQLERAAANGPEAVSAAAQGRVRLSPEEAAYLADSVHRRQLQTQVTHFLAEALSKGVADAGVMRGEASRVITLRRGDAERSIPRDSVLTFADLMDQADAAEVTVNHPVGQRTLRRLVGTFYQPTIVPDQALTSARRDRLRASVDPVKYTVRAGERIVAPGDVVTDETRAKLAGLQEEQQRRESSGLLLRSALGAFLQNLLILSGFWLLMMFYRKETYGHLRELLFFAALFALMVIVAAGIARLFPDRPELIPIPFIAILVSMLYNGRIGVFAALTLAILLDAQWALRQGPILFFGVVGGVAGAVGIRVVRRRHHLYKTIGVVAGAYVLASITVGLIQGWSSTLTVASAALGVLMGPASASFAMILLPVAESATRITTDLTLLEISDLDRPLLRRLALEAPGTWAHSLAMASLCESACNIIGANGLLARVGCYYHDIGKLSNPTYFVENQGGGPNPHDLLSPEASARIIRQHVLDGIALAEAASLPPVVKAFIPEHHGTTDITYFLNRAQRLGVPYNAADFRYPGPRPQSAETAVAMLADSAEAAVRVLESQTPEAVRAAIEQLVQQKLASGQLDDAPLTLRDLDRIKREFARVMSGTYHKRIGYPRPTGVTPEFQPVEHEP